MLILEAILVRLLGLLAITFVILLWAGKITNPVINQWLEELEPPWLKTVMCILILLVGVLLQFSLPTYTKEDKNRINNKPNNKYKQCHIEPAILDSFYNAIYSEPFKDNQISKNH